MSDPNDLSSYISRLSGEKLESRALFFDAGMKPEEMARAASTFGLAKYPSLKAAHFGSHNPKFLSAGIPGIIPGQTLLSDETRNRLDSFLFPLTQQWYRFQNPKNPLPLTRWEEWDLGVFLEHTVAIRWLQAYRQSAIVEEFRKANPQIRELLLFGSKNSILASYYGGDKKLKFFSGGDFAAKDKDWLDMSYQHLPREYMDGLAEATFLENGKSIQLLDPAFILEKLAPFNVVRVKKCQSRFKRKCFEWLCRMNRMARGVLVEASQAGREISARLRGAAELEAFRKQFRFDGNSRVDWFMAELRRLEPMWEKLVWHLETARSVFRAAGVKGLLFRSDQAGLKKIMTFAAKRENIPSVVFQHGIQAVMEGHERHFADQILFWGQGTADQFLAKGMEKNQYRVVGDFRMDDLRPPDAEERRAAKAEFGFNPDQPVFAMMTQRIFTNISAHLGLDESHRMVEMFLEAAAKKPKAQFVVKCHPAERPDEFDAVLKAAALPNVKCLSGRDALPLLRASDMVFGFASTTLLEAIRLRLPFGQFEPCSKVWIPYAREGGGALFRNSAELLLMIDEWEGGRFQTPPRESAGKQFLDKHLMGCDGLAHKRFAAELAGFYSRHS